MHTNQCSKPSSTITSPIKSFKSFFFQNTLTFTASKIGEIITHSKSPIDMPLKFNLQTLIKMKQKLIQNKQ